jgi:hypothetical protein
MSNGNLGVQKLQSWSGQWGPRLQLFRLLNPTKDRHNSLKGRQASNYKTKSKFYSPTDEQLNCLRNNFKIYIKIDIKTLSFRTVNHTHNNKDVIKYAVTLPKYLRRCILIDYFNKSNFSKIK